MAKLHLLLAVLVALPLFSHGFNFFPAIPRVPALFVFGDSLVDAGTNNYITNSTIVADMPPYGESYFGYATGRFTDGRTIVDMLAQTLGMPLTPPFYRPGPKLHGVNFASAGSGILDATDGSDGVVGLRTQLEQFEQWKQFVKQHLSEEVLEDYLLNSVAIISSGSNDIVNNYLTNVTLQLAETADAFVQSLLNAQEAVVKELHKAGLRKIFILGLGPVGCAPKARYQASTFGLANETTGCFDAANSLAKEFNAGLENLLARLTNELQDGDILLMKPYDVMVEAISKPEEHGFLNGRDACCGAGKFNAAVRCGLFHKKDKPHLCNDPWGYVFWDYGHPTESFYKFLFSKFWYGNTSVIEPVNLKQMFINDYIAVIPERA